MNAARRFLLVVPILVSCARGLHGAVMAGPISDRVRVQKITTVNDFYLVYVRRGDSLFKVISKKAEVEGCKPIRKKGYYNLRLRSTALREVNGVPLPPQNALLVNCFTLDERTTTCIEPERGIFDLHSAENLKGLCLVD